MAGKLTCYERAFANILSSESGRRAVAMSKSNRERWMISTSKEGASITSSVA